MKNKKILAIDLILIAGSLIAVYILVSYYKPVALSPSDNLVSREAVLFEFSNGNEVWLDDNLEFTSPMKISAQDDLVINLKPGHYYWKVIGELGSSDVRELTIESEINLKLRKSGEGFEVVNAGNIELSVDVYEYGKLKENVILGVDESVSGDKFVGRQNE